MAFALSPAWKSVYAAEADRGESEGLFAWGRNHGLRGGLERRSSPQAAVARFVFKTATY